MKTNSRKPRPTIPVGRSFFARHHVTVARELIGCRLFWDGVSGRIVETEAYGVEDDEACHTAFRPSAREFFCEHSPGTAYVYLNYGIHWMLNVLAADGIILIRAIEPTHGLDLMRTRRGPQISDQLLCAGPGRLGQALNLSRTDHGTSLLTKNRWIAAALSEADPMTDQVMKNESRDETVLCDRRVGLNRETEKLWRFLVANHPCVSVPFGKVKPSKSSRRK